MDDSRLDLELPEDSVVETADAPPAAKKMSIVGRQNGMPSDEVSNSSFIRKLDSPNVMVSQHNLIELAGADGVPPPMPMFAAPSVPISVKPRMSDAQAEDRSTKSISTSMPALHDPSKNLHGEDELLKGVDTPGLGGKVDGTTVRPAGRTIYLAELSALESLQVRNGAITKIHPFV